MSNRIVTLILALTLFAAPFTSRPAQAYVTELDAVLRLVPAIGGAMGGFCLGSPLGIVGKIGGAFLGWEVGKLIGTFLSHTIGGVFCDQYPVQPPLWQRLLGWGHSYSYGYGGGYGGGYGYVPYAPSSTDASSNIATLRDRWLAAVKSYEQALTSGDEATKQARRTALEAAEKAYLAAKGAASK